MTDQDLIAELDRLKSPPDEPTLGGIELMLRGPAGELVVVQFGPTELWRLGRGTTERGEIALTLWRETPHDEQYMNVSADGVAAERMLYAEHELVCFACPPEWVRQYCDAVHVQLRCGRRKVDVEPARGWWDA